MALKSRELVGLGSGGQGGGAGRGRQNTRGVDAALAQRAYTPIRIGAEFTLDVVSMRAAARVDLLASCGIPAALASSAQPVASREGWRQFVFGTIANVAKIAAAELGNKLDAPTLTFGHDALAAADVSGRASAYKKLVESGVAGADASRIVGYGEPV